MEVDWAGDTMNLLCDRATGCLICPGYPVLIDRNTHVVKFRTTETGLIDSGSKG